MAFFSNVHRGSWFGLPDFGVTERIGSLFNRPNDPNTGGSQLLGGGQVKSAVAPQPMMSTQPMMSPYSPPQGTTTGGGGYVAPTGSSGGQQPQSGGGQPPYYQDQGPSAEDLFRQQIESDYQGALGQLAGQETELGRQKTQAEAEARTAYEPAKTQLAQEQATREADITKATSGIQTTATNALAQARNIFNDIQQSNIAQLAGAGISSSSVAEALAERLGRETAHYIFQNARTRDEAMGALDEERRRVVEFVQERKTNLERELANVLSNIQNQFLAGVNQINQARNTAQAAKASANRDLLIQVRQAQDVAKQQAQLFAQQLAAFQAEKAQSLDEARKLIVNIPDAVFGSFNPFRAQFGGTTTPTQNQGVLIRRPEDQLLQPFGAGAV